MIRLTAELGPIKIKAAPPGGAAGPAAAPWAQPWGPPGRTPGRSLLAYRSRLARAGDSSLLDRPDRVHRV